MCRVVRARPPTSRTCSSFRGRPPGLTGRALVCVRCIAFYFVRSRSSTRARVRELAPSSRFRTYAFVWWRDAFVLVGAWSSARACPGGSPRTPLWEAAAACWCSSSVSRVLLCGSRSRSVCFCAEWPNAARKPTRIQLERVSLISEIAVPSGGCCLPCTLLSRCSCLDRCRPKHFVPLGLVLAGDPPSETRGLSTQRHPRARRGSPRGRHPGSSTQTCYLAHPPVGLTAFTLSEAGMVRHGLATGWRRSAVINGFGAFAAGVVDAARYPGQVQVPAVWMVVIVVPVTADRSLSLCRLPYRSNRRWRRGRPRSRRRRTVHQQVVP